VPGAVEFKLIYLITRFGVRIIATPLQVIRETQGAETPQLLAVFDGNISYQPGGQATGLGHGEPKPSGQACSHL